MKKIITGVLSAVMTASLAIASLGGITTIQADETYNIVVSTNQASMSQTCIAMKEACDRIMEESEGRIVIDFYDSANLLSVTDAFKGVQDGIADIAFVPANMTFDYFKLNGRLLVAPFIGYKSEQQAYDIYQIIREEFPIVDEECEQFGIVNLGAYFNGAVDLYAHDRNFSITTVDDLKGLKIGVSDAYLLQFMNQVGAAATFVTNADMYTSLDNNVVSGILQHPGVLLITGCADTVHKVIKFGNQGLLRSTSMILMNKNTYDRLPEDLQEIVKRNFDQFTQEGQTIQGLEIAGFMNSIDADVIELSYDEVAAFAEAGQNIVNDIIADLESNGIAGQAIYDRIQELIEEVEVTE